LNFKTLALKLGRRETIVGIKKIHIFRQGAPISIQFTDHSNKLRYILSIALR